MTIPASLDIWAVTASCSLYLLFVWFELCPSVAQPNFHHLHLMTHGYEMRRHYNPFQDCSWELTPSWKTIGNIKPNANPPLAFHPSLPSDRLLPLLLVVLIQAQILWFPKLSGGELWTIPLLSEAHCPLPEVDPPFSHHSSSRSGLQRRLNWLAPTWKGSDLSSQVPKVTMKQMLSLFPLLRAGLWLRRETGCPTFLGDPDPGQPKGKHAHCQSLCSIALKWEYLALVNLHTAY